MQTTHHFAKTQPTSVHIADSDSDSSSSPKLNAFRPPDVRHFTHPAPTKDPSEGSFQYAHYIPPWMDPSWQDEGPTRQNSDWPIKDEVLNRVRPALLAHDQLKNPTPYARRFGIFPGRADGRSRTSPTRSKARILPLDDTVKTGEQLFETLEVTTALQHGRDLEDYMTSERPELKNLSGRDQLYMQAYQELIVDEHWQGILFGNVTMDELIAGDHFTMADAILGLNGPLSPLFERHRWLDARADGTQANYPRLLYNIDGKRLEFDPRNNDEVWKALQPALQLATRMVQADDPFLTALKDITNRTRIDPAREMRADKFVASNFRMVRNLDVLDPLYPAAARDLRDCPNFDQVQASWDTLHRVFELCVCTTHYSIEDGSFGETTCLGFTSSFHGSPNIRVHLAAELIWPLLTDQFSKSEKMLASLLIAQTLAHEVMHAWEKAHTVWLEEPRSTLGVQGHVATLIEALANEMLPVRYKGCEAFFEDDPECEVGHAFEHHVLGYDSGPLSAAHPHLFLNFLTDYSILPCNSRWPDGSGRMNPKMLLWPKLRCERYPYFSKINHVQRLFRQDFWDNNVQKYGMAAVREPPKEPTLCGYNPEATWDTWNRFLQTNFGTQEERIAIEDLVVELGVKRWSTLNSYVLCLISDACRFDLMIKRFADDMEHWRTSFPKITNHCTEIQVIMSEYRACHFMTYGDPNDPANDARIEGEYQTRGTWIACFNPILDQQSMNCLGSIQDFKVGCLATDLSYEQRIIPRVMDLLHLLEDELRYQEAMACELHNLPTWYRPQYAHVLPHHQFQWLNYCNQITTRLLELVQMMDQGIGARIPTWPEWDGRLRSLATNFHTISSLLTPNDVWQDTQWRDKLVTVPRLRMSRRKPWEQWFFLAKKQMLKLEGEELRLFKEFKTRLQNLLSLGSYKIVLPESDPDVQGLAQLWAGVLDDDIEKQKTGNELNQIFNTDAARNLTQRLQAEKDKADAAKQAHVEAQVQAVSPSLAATAQAQVGRAPSIPPQITRPQVENHPVPLGGRQVPDHESPRFGVPTRSGTTSRNASGSNRQSGNVDPYSAYSSSPSPFPTQQPGASPAWDVKDASQLAAQVHQPFGNAPTPHGPTGMLLPHPYAIRETTTKDIANIASTQVPVGPPPSSTFSQSHRDHPAPYHGRGNVGRGKLGDLDKNWERLSDSDVSMTDAPPAGGVNLARAMIESESEESSSSVLSSDIEEIQRLRESSESSSIESRQDSEYGFESDLEDGSRWSGSQGSKRKFSVTNSKMDSFRSEGGKKGFMDWWHNEAIKKAKVSR